MATSFEQHVEQQQALLSGEEVDEALASLLPDEKTFEEWEDATPARERMVCGVEDDVSAPPPPGVSMADAHASRLEALRAKLREQKKLTWRKVVPILMNSFAFVMFFSVWSGVCFAGVPHILPASFHPRVKPHDPKYAMFDDVTSDVPETSALFESVGPIYQPAKMAATYPMLGAMAGLYFVPVLIWSRLRVYAEHNQMNLAPATNARLPKPTFLRYRISYTQFTVWEVMLMLMSIALNVAFVNSDSWALLMGNLTVANTALIMLTSNRVSIGDSLFNIPFERAIRFHRWIGRLIWLVLTAHLLGYAIPWFIAGTFSTEISSEKNLFGLFGWIADTIVTATSLEHFRRNKFETFYYTHFVFLLYYAFGILHSPPMLLFLAPSLALWLYDRYERQSRSTYCDVYEFEVMRDNTVKMTISSTFDYEPGSYLFLNLPGLSEMQWHPFTISSAPGAADIGKGRQSVMLPHDALTIHIKYLGEWTASLPFAMDDKPLVRIDGPYGRLSHEPYNYRSILLIGGGIGVTPMMSIMADLYMRVKNHAPMATQRVYLIWVIQTEQSYKWFSDTLSAISKSGARKFFVTTVFVTRAQRKKAASQAFKTGRPDFDDIFNSLARLHANEPRMATYVCGPAQMIRQVGDKAALHSGRNGGVVFDFHNEVFEF